MECRIAAAQLVQNARKSIDAYGAAMEPLCRQTGMPRMAMDILLFLANNPGYDTARDICQFRGLKPGIVSAYVERLAVEGFLERQQVPGDRRKTRLALTDKAQPLVDKGRRMQRAFALRIMEGLTEEELRQFVHCLKVFERNLESIRQNGLTDEMECGMEME